MDKVYLVVAFSHDGIQPITVCRTSAEAEDIAQEIRERIARATSFRNETPLAYEAWNAYPDQWALHNYHLDPEVIERDLNAPRDFIE